jgi:predicted RNA-binding Zn ribbon-like protein
MPSLVTTSDPRHAGANVPALDLVNSEIWYGLGPLEDRLDTPSWLDGFLAHHGLAAAGPPTPAARARLVRLRALLRDAIQAIAAGKAPKAGDLDELNAFVAARPATPRLVRAGGAFRLEAVPEKTDWAWVLGEIALSFARLLAEGDLRRLKVCDNGDCAWAFYDESKNRSRRWCSADKCGNLIKVRRFRERQRVASGRLKRA